MNIFDSLDGLLELPYGAFGKKLSKLEEDFRHVSLDEIPEESLDEYFLRIKQEYATTVGDGARSRLAILGYLSHFDTLVEKFFPEYVSIFETSFDREDFSTIAPDLYTFLEHMKEILRDYTHRLSDPDNYPSYTSYIQELIQSAMIDVFFWLQDLESTRQKRVSSLDVNTDFGVVASSDTRDDTLRFIRQCLELLGEGVLEKIFFDLEYPIRTSATHPDLQFIGRYERKSLDA